MTPNIKILKKASEAVAAVAASFGGFLLHIQPPESTAPNFALGFAAALSTTVFLAVSILADLLVDRKRYQITFLGIAVPLLICTMVSGFWYSESYARSTIPFPKSTSSERVIIGNLTDYGKGIVSEKGETYTQILFESGGLQYKEKIWTRDSILEAVIHLNDLYVYFSVFLSASIFCLLEGLTTARTPNREKPLPAKEQQDADP